MPLAILKFSNSLSLRMRANCTALKPSPRFLQSTLRLRVKVANKNAKIFAVAVAEAAERGQGPVGLNVQKKAIPVRRAPVVVESPIQRAVKLAGEPAVKKVTQARHVQNVVRRTQVVAVLLVGIVVGKRATQVPHVLHVAESVLQQAVALVGHTALVRATQAQRAQVVAGLIRSHLNFRSRYFGRASFLALPIPFRYPDVFRASLPSMV